LSLAQAFPNGKAVVHSRSKSGVAWLAYGERRDPVFRSVRDSIADAAAYWMPAFAGTTAECYGPSFK
jgi:hypothetical protein